MDDATEDTLVSAPRLAGLGLVALITVCIVNVLVLFAGLALIDYPTGYVGGRFGPLAVRPVVGTSAVAAIGATLVYAVLARCAARPNRAFTRIAGILLILSFGMLLAPDLAGAPLTVYGTLAVMHVAAAVAIVAVLTRAQTRNASAPTEGTPP